MNRRGFLQTTAAWGAAALCGVNSTAQDSRGPRILLRSSWQTVNIGDIAHTPGLIAILERHFPKAEVRLWPSRVDHGVDALLLKRFPNLTIVQRETELKAAFDQCDFLLHGSGA